MIVLVGGLPGSGKTYFARKLAERIDAEFLSSDALRKSLRARGRYDIDEKLLVYRELARIAEFSLSAKGAPVIVDATFSHREMRKLFIDLAEKKSLPIKFIWIYADEELIKERTNIVREDSEADYTVYLKIREEAEPWEMAHLSLESTNDNIETMLSKAIPYLFSDATT